MPCILASVCTGLLRSTPNYDMDTGSSLSVGENSSSFFSCGNRTKDKLAKRAQVTQACIWGSIYCRPL